jgi:hypothetical protein
VAAEKACANQFCPVWRPDPPARSIFTEDVSTMLARRIAVRVGLIATIFGAGAARAEEPTLETGMSVVAKSPGFVLRDGRLAVECASNACRLTGWKDAECLMALANAHSLLGDGDAAVAAIDKAIALLESGDKRLKICQSMRESFRGNVLSRPGVEKFFEQ